MTPQPRRNISDLDPRSYVSIPRVAAFWNCSYKQVWGAVKAGDLAHKRVGRKRVIRIQVKAALEWGDGL